MLKSLLCASEMHSILLDESHILVGLLKAHDSKQIMLISYKINAVFLEDNQKW